MLAELNIQNFALIDTLQIEFPSGFSVLTGETGAGKSIIINALMLVLGARGSREMIQTGKDRLVVQAALFSNTYPRALGEVLDTLGIERSESILLYRELHENGRNVCRINGTMVTVADLKKVGDQLVDIHSQRDHNLILNKEEHLGMLDAFGQNGLAHWKAETSECYDKWHDTMMRRKDVLKAVAEGEKQMDVYRFQLNEIDGVSFQVGEDDLLEERVRILNHSEVLFRNGNQAYDEIYGGEPAALGLLFQARKSLETMAQIDGTLDEPAQRLEEIIINLEDLAHTIRTYKDGIPFDDQELDQAQSKLNKLTGLKRKYGGSLQEVLDYKEALEEKIRQYENKDQYLAELEIQLERLRKEYLQAATKLHEQRVVVGQEFSAKINEQLQQLAMPESRLSVRMDWNKEENTFSPDGLDQVEFFIQTNKGEEPKPLIRIASGGEISRIMLAIKSIMGMTMGTKCLIFDEVDTGISGIAAGSVGEKMRELSANAQVIAITHLPQIASMAHTHYEVSKDTQEEKTRTSFHKLQPEDRIRVLAVMMDGRDNPKGRALAQEMLQRNGIL